MGWSLVELLVLVGLGCRKYDACLGLVLIFLVFCAVVMSMPALVVPTMAAVAFDVSVSPGAPALPAPLLATTVAVPAAAAAEEPMASSGRAAPALDVATMASVAFAAAVVSEASVRPAPAPVTPVATTGVGACCATCCAGSAGGACRLVHYQARPWC